MKNSKLREALLVIDMQNDFCPGGALGVPEGDKIVPMINKYIKIFTKKKLPIFFTQDWHPALSRHFKDFGGKWPAHCIQNSQGAQLHSGLGLSKQAIFLYKGMDPKKDAYSAFQAEDASGTSFPQLLKQMSIGTLYVAGLATDYCVKFSVQDSLKQGIKVKILLDAIKGVNFNPGDSQEAIRGMIKAGAKKETLKNFKKNR